MFFYVQHSWAILTFETKLTVDNNRDRELFRDCPSSDLSLAMVRSCIPSFHLFKVKRVVRVHAHTSSHWSERGYRDTVSSTSNNCDPDVNIIHHF